MSKKKLLDSDTLWDMDDSIARTNPVVTTKGAKHHRIESEPAFANREFRTLSEHERGNERLVETSETRAGDAPFDDAQHANLVRLVAKRIFMARGFHVMYFLMFFVQLAVLIWGAMHHYYWSVGKTGHHTPETAWFVILDVVITIIFTIEVIIRMLATRNYFSHCMNRMDAFAVLLSIAALFLYAYSPAAAVYGQVAIGIRYAIQLFRLSVILKSWVENKSALRSSSQEVHFDESFLNVDAMYFDVESTTSTPSLVEVFGRKSRTKGGDNPKNPHLGPGQPTSQIYSSVSGFDALQEETAGT